MDKAHIQEAQYEFPYHHIPWSGSKNGVPERFQALRWSFEYACYIGYLADMIRELGPASILDVGCGDGAFLKVLHGTVPRAVGADTSEQAIRFARAFDQVSEYRSEDVGAIQECFDVVTVIEVLEHIPGGDIVPFLQGTFRRVKPGGHMIICVPTSVRPVSPKHYRHYTVQRLRGQIREAGLDVVESAEKYVYKKSPFVDCYLKMTMNRFGAFKVNAMERLIWRFVVRRSLHATAENGTHLILGLRKVVRNETSAGRAERAVEGDKQSRQRQ